MRGEMETILEGREWVTRGSSNLALVYENLKAYNEYRAKYYGGQNSLVSKIPTEESNDTNIQTKELPQFTLLENIGELESDDDIIVLFMFIMLFVSIAMLLVVYSIFNYIYIV